MSMIHKHIISAILALALGVGLLGTVVIVHAGNGPAYISNISVDHLQIPVNGTATYVLCIVAPSAPTQGGVLSIIDPNGNAETAGLSYSGGLCSASQGTYYMSASFGPTSRGSKTGVAGKYTFNNACVFPYINPDQSQSGSN